LKAYHTTLYRYSIPFREPVTVKGCQVLQRDGIILALKNREENQTAYGEIAPLPGLHKESLQAAEAQLVEVLSKRELTNSVTLQEKLYPSVRSGLEMAMINLDNAIPGACSSFFPSVPAAKYVPVNALLFGDTPLIMQRAEEYLTLGYRTFKLKITGSNIETAIRSIGALHRTFGNRIELRLDANQSFSIDEAIRFAGSIPRESIAYIEEPLKEPELIGEFHAKTALRSALDETLWQKPELLRQLPANSLRALILKPNRLGGIAITMQFAKYASENNLIAVFSSAFESGISLSFYTWLAASACMKPAACGLDTYRYLQYDLLETPFGTENGLLDASRLYRNGQKVDQRALQRTSLWTL